MAPVSIESPGRIPELDSLRGFAAIGVLLMHALPGAFFWGWSCVDLFFILSGFLITGILLKHRDRPRMLVAFYIRRALRIWPVYYLAFIAAALIYIGVGYMDSGQWRELPQGHWLALVFLQYADRYAAAIPDLAYIHWFEHSWSLAVEEQFYLLWPLIFFAARPSVRTLLVLYVLAAGAGIWARASGFIPILMLTRIDGLLLGMLLAHLAMDRDSLLHRGSPAVWLAVGAVGVLGLLPYLMSRGQHGAWGGEVSQVVVEVTAFALLYAAIVAAVVRRTGARGLALLRWAPFIHLGKLSFAIYMFQVPLMQVMKQLVRHDLVPLEWAIPVLWAAVLLTAQLSHILVERHALALKARFPY